jgi:hypothetical protein
MDADRGPLTFRSAVDHRGQGCLVFNGGWEYPALDAMTELAISHRPVRWGLRGPA